VACAVRLSIFPEPVPRQNLTLVKVTPARFRQSALDPVAVGKFRQRKSGTALGFD